LPPLSPEIAVIAETSYFLKDDRLVVIGRTRPGDIATTQPRQNLQNNLR